MHILFFLAIGGLSGWLAGNIFEDIRFNQITNIVIGFVGGLLGKWYSTRLVFDVDNLIFIWNTIITIVGALQLLYLFSINVIWWGEL